MELNTFLEDYFMRKIYFGVISLIIFFVGCAGNPQPATSSGSITLDQAIEASSKQIEERIQRGSKIAILNFNSSSDEFSEYVIDELTANLVNNRILTIVDRREIELIREEFDFQFSGEVSDDSAQRMGQMLGAQAIVSGSLRNIGGDFRIVIRVLNVQNATVEVQYRADIVNDNRVQALLASGRAPVGGRTLAGNQPTQPQGQTAAVQAVPPAPVFRIGDTGPAGGIVFFDKGNHSGGWRYLEAASTDLGPAVFATEMFTREEIRNIGFIDGNNERGSRAVGTGKSNTEHLMRIANNKGGGFGWAVQLASRYELNGFNDWFLPSQDELNHMYGNLHMRNLGSFSSQRYWSSSIGEPNSSMLWWTLLQFSNFSNGEVGTAVGTELSGSVNYLSTRYLVRPVR
jgi:TolB-like protein